MGDAVKASRGYHQRMNIRHEFVAILALGLSVSCTAEASDDESKPPPKVVETPDTAPKVENVDAAGAVELIAENDGVIILDIRTPDEFKRGHLKGAINIDYRAEDYAAKIGELDKEKTYLVH